MSELKIKIQIDNILEVESGESTNGEWSKVSFIGTELDSEYPKSIGFEYFGKEKVDKFLQYNKVGDEVEVSFNLQSREYNGKIYTTAQAWKTWNLQTSASAAPVPVEDDAEEDDLPF
jgi:hypothetical protein